MVGVQFPHSPLQMLVTAYYYMESTNKKWTHIAVKFVGILGSLNMNRIWYNIAVWFIPLIHFFVFQLVKEQKLKPFFT